MKPDVRKRLADSVETAVALAEGIVEIESWSRRRRQKSRAKPSTRTGRQGRARVGRHARLLGEVLLPELRHVDAGAGAADLLLQLAARRLPALHRPRLADGDRPRPGGRPDADDQRGRDPALELGRPTTTSSSRRRSARSTRSTSTCPGRTCRRRTRTCSCTGAEGERVYVSYRNRMGRRRSYMAPLEGIVHEPRAPLSGDRLRVFARADRGVHVGAAVPRVRRRAAAAREPGREGRRHRHPRVHAQVGARGDRVARRARAERAPSGRSRRGS